jgi:hypothetical protein
MKKRWLFIYYTVIHIVLVTGPRNKVSEMDDKNNDQIGDGD